MFFGLSARSFNRRAMTMLALRNPRGKIFARTARDRLLQALSIIIPQHSKKHRIHFTLGLSARRAFCLLFVGTKSRKK